MTNHPNRTAATLPQVVIEKTREFAFDFNFGEWQQSSILADFIKQEFGFTGTTHQQYAQRFIKRGVDNHDFESRLNGRQWRWIVHS